MAVLATTSKSRRDRSDYTNRFHILRKEQVIKCIAGAFKKKLQKLVKLYFEVEAFKKKKIQTDNCGTTKRYLQKTNRSTVLEYSEYHHSHILDKTKMTYPCSVRLAEFVA